MKNYNQFINEGGKLGLPELPVEVAGAMIKIGLIRKSVSRKGTKGTLYEYVDGKDYANNSIRHNLRVTTTYKEGKFMQGAILITIGSMTVLKEEYGNEGGMMKVLKKLIRK